MEALFQCTEEVRLPGKTEVGTAAACWQEARAGVPAGRHLRVKPEINRLSAQQPPNNKSRDRNTLLPQSSAHPRPRPSAPPAHYGVS